MITLLPTFRSGDKQNGTERERKRERERERERKGYIEKMHMCVRVCFGEGRIQIQRGMAAKGSDSTASTQRQEGSKGEMLCGGKEIPIEVSTTVNLHTN